MKKLVILLMGVSLMAASCDLVDIILGNPTGVRGVFKSSDNAETFRAAMKLSKGDLGGVSVNSLSFDTANPETVYLASPSGIYKTEDGAANWRYILSGLASARVAVDPKEAKIVYAVGLVGQNGKIIKSFDGGISWVDIYTEPSKNNPVLALDISKSNSAILVAGLSNGEIIRSLDAGQTWQSSRDFADRILSLEFSSTGDLYALTLAKGLFLSRDSGATWAAASGGLASVLTDTIGQRAGSVSKFDHLALDKRQPGVLYLGTDQGLYRSVNNGASWAALPLPVRNASLRVSSVAVNPGNSNHLIVAVGNTVFKSVNGGVTWETKVLNTGAEIKQIIINPQSTNVIYLGVGNPR